MHEYRVYLLNDEDKIAGALWVEADSLDAAIVNAIDETSGARCEIWEGTRLLTKIWPGAAEIGRSVA
jgi:hypothetical protein